MRFEGVSLDGDGAGMVSKAVRDYSAESANGTMQKKDQGKRMNSGGGREGEDDTEQGTKSRTVSDEWA